jgi:hypothetical protein
MSEDTKPTGTTYHSLAQADDETDGRFAKVTPRYVTGASEGLPPLPVHPLPDTSGIERAHDGTAKSDVLGEDLSGKGGNPMSKSPKISARQIADIGRMIQFAETAALKHGMDFVEILQITKALAVGECTKWPDCPCGEDWRFYTEKVEHEWEAPDAEPSASDIQKATIDIIQMMKCVRLTCTDPEFREAARIQLGQVQKVKDKMDREPHLD